MMTSYFAELRCLSTLLLATSTFLLPGCGDDAAERIEGTEPGDCSDAADNDADGLFDCDDDSCAGSPTCQSGDSGQDASSTVDGDVSADSAVHDSGTDAGADSGAEQSNEIAQVCLQSDYVPGQRRTPSWVSLTAPEKVGEESTYLVGHWLAMPLVPDSYPFTVREVQYELGSAQEPPCAAPTSHNTQVFVGTSRTPPEMPTVERTWRTEVSSGLLRAIVRHTVEPPITLTQGQVLFVAIEQPQAEGDFPCPVSCRVGDDVDQAAFRSTTPPESVTANGYDWQDISTFSSYRSDPTVPWVAMLAQPVERTVPNLAFDTPSDGSQENCIAHIEYVDDARVKCTVNHLCGDDGYRMACLTPSSCACAINSEPTCPGGGEPPCPVEKPEGLCELTPREAEAIAINVCDW